MPMFQLDFDDGTRGFFDSSTTTFFTGSMQKLEIEKFLPRMKAHDNESSYTHTGLRKCLSPDFVRIVLGFKCNYHCKYCSQGLASKGTGTSVDESAVPIIGPPIITFFGSASKPPAFSRRYETGVPILTL